MFIKIPILTCVALYFDFVHSYTSKELHNLYEDEVINKEHSRKDFLNPSVNKNIWVFLCECAYQNLRKNTKYEEAYLSYNSFYEEISSKEVDLKLDYEYLQNYKFPYKTQLVAPCYGRRMVLPYRTIPKDEDLFHLIAIFVLPEIPHDIVVFRKIEKTTHEYSLFDWIKEKAITHIQNDNAMKLLNRKLPIPLHTRIIPAISYNDQKETWKCLVSNWYNADESAFIAGIREKRRNSWLLWAPTPKFQPDSSSLTRNSHFVRDTVVLNQMSQFARLCKMALRPSTHPNFIVDMKSLKENKINMIERRVKFEKYKWTVQMYPCSGFNAYKDDSGLLLIDDILDKETYTISDGVLEKSMHVYKRAERYYEIIEIIGELYEHYVSKIDDDTEIEKKKAGEGTSYD